MPHSCSDFSTMAKTEAERVAAHPERLKKDPIRCEEDRLKALHLTRARMHHKVVGNFGSEADVRSLYYRRFRFNETSDVGTCTHIRLAK